MAAGDTDALRGALQAVHSACPGVEGSAIVTCDGVVLASMLSGSVDPDRFGAMCATLLALAGRMAQEVSHGALRQVIVEGELGPVLLTQAGDVGVLALAANLTAPLGRLIVTARQAAGALQRGTAPLAA